MKREGIKGWVVGIVLGLLLGMAGAVFAQAILDSEEVSIEVLPWPTASVSPLATTEAPWARITETSVSTYDPDESGLHPGSDGLIMVKYETNIEVAGCQIGLPAGWTGECYKTAGVNTTYFAFRVPDTASPGDYAITVSLMQ